MLASDLIASPNLLLRLRTFSSVSYRMSYDTHPTVQAPESLFIERPPGSSPKPQLQHHDPPRPQRASSSPGKLCRVTLRLPSGESPRISVDLRSGKPTKYILPATVSTRYIYAATSTARPPRGRYHEVCRARTPRRCRVSVGSAACLGAPWFMPTAINLRSDLWGRAACNLGSSPSASRCSCRGDSALADAHVHAPGGYLLCQQPP